MLIDPGRSARAFTCCMLPLVTCCWCFGATLHSNREPGVSGDFNLDGKTDFSDVDAFVVAVHRPDVWQQRYGATLDDLLTEGDFNGDKLVDIRDIDAFAVTLALYAGIADDVGARSAGESSTNMPGIDADVDSNNDNGAALPDRSAAEDAAEDVAGFSGKRIFGEEPLAGIPRRIPMQIAHDAPFASCDYGRHYEFSITYPASRIEVYAASAGGAPLPSGVPLTSLRRVFWAIGDLDGNGVFSVGDIGPWILLLTNIEAFGQQYPCVPILEAGDFNRDGIITLGGDHAKFVAGVQAGRTEHVPTTVYVQTAPKAPHSESPGDIIVSVASSTQHYYNEGGACSECPTKPVLSHDVLRFTAGGSEGILRPRNGIHPITPYSSVDLLTGNVTTKLPITAFQPLGPPVVFGLYHQSLPSVHHPERNPFGVALGGGWRLSYGGYLRCSGDNQVVEYVCDDGRVDIYVAAEPGSVRNYNPPSGVYDDLRFVNGEWVMTTPNQEKLHFGPSETSGIWQFVRASDSAGNVLSLCRSDDRSMLVVAADREVRDAPCDDAPPLIGSVSVRQLVGAQSGVRLEDSTAYEPLRRWDIRWDHATRQLTVRWYISIPEGLDEVHHTRFQHAADGKIVDVIQFADQTQSVVHQSWHYGYDEVTGRLITVADQGNNGVNNFLQAFVYTRPNADKSQTVYFGRRYWDDPVSSFDPDRWTFSFDRAGDLVERIDPLGNVRNCVYDRHHHLVATTSELQNTGGVSHTWRFQYGDAGELLSRESPLGQKWTTVYDAVPGGLWNSRRVRQSIDPDGSWTTYDYGVSGIDPTLATEVHQGDGDGGEIATTRLEYYADSVPTATGDQRKRKARKGGLAAIVDPNGARHEFDYNEHGFRSSEQLGVVDGWRTVMPENSTPVRSSDVTNVGVSTGGASSGNGVTGSCSLSGAGQPLECKCLWLLDGRGTPSFTPRQGIVHGPAQLPGLSCNGEVSYINRAFGPIRRVETAIDCDAGISLSNFPYVDTVWAFNYNDPLLRLTAHTQKHEFSTPGGVALERTFLFLYNLSYQPPETDATQIVGPDGSTVRFQRADGQYGFDALGRPNRISQVSGLLQVWQDFMYDADGRVERIVSSNGTTTVREYDAAARLVKVTHLGLSGHTLLEIEYAWRSDNVVTCRREYDGTASPPRTTWTDFSYDWRKRLSREHRFDGQSCDAEGPVSIYDYRYAYDRGGNRLVKYNAVTGQRVQYFYDVDSYRASDDPYGPGKLTDPRDFSAYPLEPYLMRGEDGALLDVVTADNRLRYYVEDYGAAPETRRVSYTYYKTGDVSNIAVKDQSDSITRGVSLFYRTNGQLWRAYWDQWEANAPGVSNYQILADPAPREFYFNADGGLMLTRAMTVSPANPYPTSTLIWTVSTAAAPDRFSDMLGIIPWSDFAPARDPSNGSYSNVLSSVVRRIFSPGVISAYSDGLSGATTYLHGDLTDSKMLQTDQAGQPVPVVDAGASAITGYTAFGEPLYEVAGPGGPETVVGGEIPNPEHRHAFVGGYGYEQDLLVIPGAAGTLPVTISHVGARWYDPAIGRFLQRDPAGLLGGVNLYVYGDNNPVVTIDPEGLMGYGPGGQYDSLDDLLSEIAKALKEVRYNWTRFMNTSATKHLDRVLAAWRRLENLRRWLPPGFNCLALAVGLGALGGQAMAGVAGTLNEGYIGFTSGGRCGLGPGWIEADMGFNPFR